ncbi:Rv3654c family TadE-like protein [Corynebacterium confusum]|uniref:Rv3654c family TadE-like protein n=1 Tax=uncultured Corynebacterium sp. TaxID=159447 RepID=UPI0025D4E470|nr:Rv3654c family TadE-like protein [uncultured Corynebacterium sp.]
MDSPAPARRRAGALARQEDGYATVTAAGIIVALASVLLAVAGIAAHVIARHEAQVAADLAAVAGAYALATGQDACAAAQRTTEHNAARLDTCTVSGRDVVVGASVRWRGAQAKAGPA